MSDTTVRTTVDEGQRADRRRLRQRWEDVTSVPLALLGLAFIAAFIFLSIDQTPTSTLRNVAGWVLAASWVGFVLDTVVRLAITPRGERGQFLLRHPLDLLSAALPLFRAVKVVQLLHRVPVLRRRTGSAVRASLLITGVAYVVVFVTFIALATLQAERGVPGATIDSFGNAMWWSVVTLTTVGYGDLVPVTVVGRLYAVALMLGGVVIVGSISALMVSALTERIKRIVDHPTRPADGPERDGERPVS